MSVEDPFFVVKGEVESALVRCQQLRHEWKNILDDVTLSQRDDYDRISGELRNSIRSIVWDLEDLDETIGIVEKNPQKFHIDSEDLDVRKRFITATTNKVKEMENELNDPKTKLKAEQIFRKSLLSTSKHHHSNQHSNNGGDGNYENAAYMDHDQTQMQIRQNLIIKDQDEQLELVANSVGVLKSMSQSIGNELTEQSVIINNLGDEIENTQNKMDAVLRKMAKVTHMSNDGRQWCAIGVLGSSIFAIFILFIIL